MMGLHASRFTRAIDTAKTLEALRDWSEAPPPEEGDGGEGDTEDAIVSSPSLIWLVQQSTLKVI